MTDDILNKLIDINNEKISKVKPANVKTGVTMFGVAGTYTADADATAANILSSKTAYVNGSKITGSMANNGALSYTPTESSQSIPAGYTSGGTVAAMDYTTTSDYQNCLAASYNILTGNAGYTELEYIRGTGTQWINTKYVPTAETNFKLKISNVTSGDYAIFGQNNWSDNTRLLTSQSSSLKWYYGSSNKTVTSSYSAVNTIELYNNYIKCNDTVVSDSTTKNSNVEASNTIKLFCVSNGQHISTHTLYYFQIYEGSTLVRNFIPVKNPLNEACLYETITSSYFFNSGTGSFTAGPVVEEE